MKLACLAILIVSLTAVGGRVIIDPDLEQLIASCGRRPTNSCLREIRARLSVIAIGRDVDVDEDCDDDRIVDDGDDDDRDDIDDDDDDGERPIPPRLEGVESSLH